MARSFKLKCHRFISSFRFCRPKHPLTFPANPLPKSPLIPNPPLSTPLDFLSHHRSSSSSKNIISLYCSCKLKSSMNQEKGFGVAQKGNKPVSEIDETHRSASKSWIPRKKTMKKNKKEKKVIGRGDRDKPKANCWSNGYDGEEDEDEETEGLMDSSKSFSDEFYGYKWRDSRRGRERFVMVKIRSKKPYEEFKRSMVEMIMEEEIFEANGLEELLRCYLSLNLPEYRGVIVEAFSEVWEFLFCGKKELAPIPNAIL